VADRRSTAPALKLYERFVRELEGRIDQLPAEDRQRTEAFLIELANGLEEPEAVLRRTLAAVLASTFPDSAGARHAYATWLMREQDWDAAHDHLQAALQCVSADRPDTLRQRSEIARGLARIERARGKPEVALENLMASIDADPLQVEGYVEAAEATLELSREFSPDMTTISASRKRARIAKALRWLRRAEENARQAREGGVPHGDAVRQRIDSLREELTALQDRA
jgi:tetratricopeptide (TPR) repeat protein